MQLHHSADFLVVVSNAGHRFVFLAIPLKTVEDVGQLLLFRMRPNAYRERPKYVLVRAEKEEVERSAFAKTIECAA